MLTETLYLQKYLLRGLGYGLWRTYWVLSFFVLFRLHLRVALGISFLISSHNHFHYHHNHHLYNNHPTPYWRQKWGNPFYTLLYFGLRLLCYWAIIFVRAQRLPNHKPAIHIYDLNVFVFFVSISSAVGSKPQD